MTRAASTTGRHAFKTKYTQTLKGSLTSRELSVSRPERVVTRAASATRRSNMSAVNDCSTSMERLLMLRSGCTVLDTRCRYTYATAHTHPECQTGEFGQGCLADAAHVPALLSNCEPNNITVAACNPSKAVSFVPEPAMRRHTVIGPETLS